jgi:hypothetical protein
MQRLKQILNRLTKTVIVSVLILTLSGTTLAWHFYNSNVEHLSQEETNTCGPTTMAMWLNAIYRGKGWNFRISPSTLDQYRTSDGNSGTSLPEFRQGMYDWTPADYFFADWIYGSKYTAMKAAMWTIARYGEPMAVSGGPPENFGIHYVLIRGGEATGNPYWDFGENCHITGVYVNDATEGSRHYSVVVSGLQKWKKHSPEDVMNYWTPRQNSWWRQTYEGIPAQTWHSVERDSCQCEGQKYLHVFNSY